MLDLRGVDDPGGDTGSLEKGINTVPVDAGTFPDPKWHAERHPPGPPGSLVAFEAVERALCLGDAPLVVFDQYRDGLAGDGHRYPPSSFEEHEAFA
jgi:hypothetical protein